MGDLLAVVHAQRACRRFDPGGKVLDSDLEQILQAAVHAPSAENTQPWAFVVVREERTRSELARWWAQTWNAGGGDFVRQSVDDRALVADLEFGFSKGGFAAAPVVLVVSADTDRVAEIYAPSSIFPAVQNLLLARRAGQEAVAAAPPLRHVGDVPRAVRQPLVTSWVKSLVTRTERCQCHWR